MLVIERDGKPISQMLTDAKQAAAGAGPNLSKAVRAPWTLTRDAASEIKRGGPFKTTFYKNALSELWWTPDLAGHGDSAFKVYSEGARGLAWFRDADEYGTYLDDKWKGGIGRFIPWSDLGGR